MYFLDGTFCADTANIWQILGYVVNVIKIVIPLVLIILGMLDLGKAVVADKDDAINKAVKSLVHRFIAALVMFFIPTIISAVFGLIKIGDLKSNDANICVQCITNVNGKETIDNPKYTPGGTEPKKVGCQDVAEDAPGI